MRAQGTRGDRRRGRRRRAGVRGYVVLVSCVCVAPTLAAGSTPASSKLPSFAHPKYYKTFKSSSSVAIGDLNGDGRPDLGVANIGGAGQGSPGAVSVLINKGGGSFQASRNYLTDKSYDIAISDFNGDRKPDIAVMGGESFSVVVFLNNGDGTLGEGQYYPVGSFDNHSQALAAGDLNGDGKPDIVTANPNFGDSPGTISVLINNGDGTFRPKVDYPSGGGPDPLSVAIGDLNGDRRADLAVANDSVPGKPGTVSVFIGRGDGTLQSPRLYRTGSRPTAVAIGDLDGNGKPDLATANVFGNSVSVLLNQGNGSFRAKRDYRTSVACRQKACAPQSVVIGDLNGDRKPEVMVANAGAPTLTVVLNRGDGTFSTKRDYRMPAAEIALGDLNGDRRLDVAAAGGGGVSVLLNTTRRS